LDGRKKKGDEGKTISKILIRAVMGSVSSYLVEHCPCPVLIMKLEHDEVEDRKELNANKSSHLQHVFGRLIAIFFF
jgi:hypothetical protein